MQCVLDIGPKNGIQVRCVRVWLLLPQYPEAIGIRLKLPFAFQCFIHRPMHMLGMLLFQPSQNHLMIVSAYSVFLIIFCFFSIIYFSLSFRADAIKVLAFRHQLGLQQSYDNRNRECRVSMRTADFALERSRTVRL